jgi:hypothetical protein
VVRAGGNFMGAMDAASKTVETLAPEADRFTTIDQRNQERIDALAQRRERRTAALLDIAERMIRVHMHQQPEHEIVMAISRAWRVLMGGGTLCAAVYRATNGLEPG